MLLRTFLADSLPPHMKLLFGHEKARKGNTTLTIKV